MRLILLGPPGSGKGTQARLLCQRLSMAHISTGDILREAVRLSTPLGRQAQAFMDQGQYVPDALVNDIVAERLSRADRPQRFVMDGYPRTLEQAAALDALLKDLQLPIDAVILLQVDDDEIVRRIQVRLAKEQRSDDATATVRERLRLFRATLPSVIDYYRRQGLLREVDGKGSVEDIYQAMERCLGLGEVRC
jgi:adenylate kinase